MILMDLKCKRWSVLIDWEPWRSEFRITKTPGEIVIVIHRLAIMFEYPRGRKKRMTGAATPPRLRLAQAA